MFPFLPFDPIQAFSAAAMNVGQQMGVPAGLPAGGGARPVGAQRPMRARRGDPALAPEGGASSNAPQNAPPKKEPASSPAKDAGSADAKPSPTESGPLRATAETAARAVAFGGAAFAAFGLLRKLV
jgi:hypothetical protein